LIGVGRGRPPGCPIRRATTHHAIPFDIRASDSTNDSTQPVTGAQTETNQLTREEINTYLEQKNRSADSLITAYRLTRDSNFLSEAAGRYPNDPRVQFEILGANLFPQDRWHSLEAFKQNAPDNSLPNYLAAREYFKAGQLEKALGEFTEARDKSALDMYWLGGIQGVAEAYVSAGFAPGDAYFVGLASSGTQLTTLSEIRNLSSDLASLATQYRQSGDFAKADSLTTIGLTLGDRLAKGDTPKLLIDEVVGGSVQRIMLQDLAPSAKIEFGGNARTAAEQLAKIQSRRDVIKNLSVSVPLTDLIISHEIRDDDVAAYFEHVRTDGDFAALQWLRDKLGRNPPTQPQPSASERK
jgi:hypothetical protein